MPSDDIGAAPVADEPKEESTPVLLAPSEQIEVGMGLIKGALDRLVGQGAEHPMLQDARTHLNAAEACIAAFVGAPAEAAMEDVTG